jgi:hypothetical protein
MISKRIQRYTTLLAIVILSGCVTIPSGPSVLVLPAPGKTIEQFHVEDVSCRQWAGERTGMSAQDTANKNTVSGAAVGTAIGAGAGALIGGLRGRPVKARQSAQGPDFFSGQHQVPVQVSSMAGKHNSAMIMLMCSACMQRATRSPAGWAGTGYRESALRHSQTGTPCLRTMSPGNWLD